MKREVGFRLASFADSEGHFAIMRMRSRGRRAGYSCAFYANVRWDDREILERYCEATGLGGITYNTRNPEHHRHAKPYARWAVERRGECLVLVQIFEEFPLWTKKARDFAIWAQAVRYWNGDRPEGMAPLARWFQEIRDAREYEAEPPPVSPPIPSLFDSEPSAS